jgi:hypothetical protein
LGESESGLLWYLVLWLVLAVREYIEVEQIDDCVKLFEILRVGTHKRSQLSCILFSLLRIICLRCVVGYNLLRSWYTLYTISLLYLMKEVLEIGIIILLLSIILSLQCLHCGTKLLLDLLLWSSEELIQLITRDIHVLIEALQIGLLIGEELRELIWECRCTQLVGFL